MKIVIDIDEDTYNGMYRVFDIANKYDCPKPTELEGRLMQAIYDGTPLPKGHGRLIDADALVAEWKNGFHKKMVEALMDDAPTIIGADKENAE